MSKRDVSDILNFRGDLSPFLVHLTRTFESLDAKKRLRRIIATRTLVAGSALVSHATFGYRIGNLSAQAKHRLFSAICFTETPLNETHCLLEVAGREVDLAPYGLVFLKDRLGVRGVSPVLYLNNTQGDKDVIVRGLDKLIDTNREVAESVLPLIAVFGKQLQSVYTAPSHRTGKLTSDGSVNGAILLRRVTLCSLRTMFLLDSVHTTTSASSRVYGKGSNSLIQQETSNGTLRN
jgi:hypothetical protein